MNLREERKRQRWFARNTQKRAKQQANLFVVLLAVDLLAIRRHRVEVERAVAGLALEARLVV